MSAEILTLCDSCATVLSDGFRVTRISHQITTEKKPICERCRKKYRDGHLVQYTVTSRRK